MSGFISIAETRTSLDAADYLIDDGMSMALFLAVKLGQPLPESYFVSLEKSGSSQTRQW